MNYYQFHIGDYVRCTAHLTPLEDIAYRRVLDLYYSHGGPLDMGFEQIVRLTRMRGHEDDVKCVLAEFFTESSGVWSNARADEELDAYAQKADAARANGARGGRPKKAQPVPPKNPEETQSVILANPDETHEKANQEPITINQEPITTTSSARARAAEVLAILQEVPGYARAAGARPEHIEEVFSENPDVPDGEWPKIARRLRSEKLERPALKENSTFSASPAADLRDFLPKWRAAQARGQPTPTRRPSSKNSPVDLLETYLSDHTA